LGGAYVGENISVLEVAGTSGLTASQLIFKKWETGYDTTDSVPRLLIAEDDLDLSAFMESVLGEYYELIQVMNGEEALSYLNTNPAPDLIISDVMMPNMDGFQLLERLKADERYRYLPVLILTARATDPDRLTALNLGVDGYLTKPFSETLLIAEIEAIIGRKPPNKSASEHAHVSSSVLTEEDQKWLKELERTVVGNLKNPEYNIDLLAQSLFMSRTNFFEKIKKLTGLTPNQYLQEARLLEARHLLERRMFHSVDKVAEAVGFTSGRYFATIYRRRFGISPKSYV
jgi:DNA-binding response OmpR family regulator